MLTSATIKRPPNVGNTVSVINTPERLWMVSLLINNAEAPTIRELSAISGLSLGFISQFSNLLRQRGFIKPGRRLQVVEPGQLLNIIRDLYFFEANEIFPYYSQAGAEELIKKLKLANENKRYALTRMSGSSLIAPYVRYQLVDFYVADTKEIPYWKDYLKLVDVEISGNVNIVIPQDPRILAQVQKLKGVSVVNNIQLYLDLYKYPARGREQAEYLREQVIKI